LNIEYKDVDYQVLSNHMARYSKLCEWYKVKPKNMDDLQYRNVCEMAESITETYNNATVIEQKVIKLTWWDKENLSDDVICDVIGMKSGALKRMRTRIINTLAGAVAYV
jgi:hypothetical protein